MFNRVCNSIRTFIKKETILFIATVLAIVSMFFVTPDKQYAEYIDYRTLAILYSLMIVVAGLQKQAVFDRLASYIVGSVSRLRTLIIILIMMCFVFSMLITNDVALITFVPLAITSLRFLGDELSARWIIPVVVMQTIAANLGSMLTPIGNPQNLYLYGLSDMSIGSFVKITAPFVILSGFVIVLWCVFACGKKRNSEIKVSLDTIGQNSDIRKICMYIAMFLICILTVARLIPYPVTLAIVFVLVLIFDSRILISVDYALLLTFVAFFVFIGNMGRIEVFKDMLCNLVSGHEVATAVVSSQVISNVPAALLLSGFTGNIKGLIIGTNLGGLGTLIASMASLISFKWIAREGCNKGRYILCFTISNIAFLVLLVAFYIFLNMFNINI